MKNFTVDVVYRRKKIKKAIYNKIKLFLTTIILIAIFYNVSLIVQSIINPRQTPKFFGIKTFTIISGSMQPDINIGDIVIVKEVERSDLYVGDIITFRKNNEIITHRINKIEEENGKEKFTTKGDRNDSLDIQKTVFENIEGKVIYKIPYIGYITLILKNKFSILIIILTFFITYAFDAKKQSRRIMRKQKMEFLNKRRKSQDEEQ